MAIVTVYNRDGSVYGELDTNNYIFNNNVITFTPQKIDQTKYPYVKINGIYYINDGDEFYSLARTDNSAVLMSINNTYLYDDNSILESCLITLLPEGADATKPNVEFLQTDLKKTGMISIKNYNINGKSIQGLCFDENQNTLSPYRHDDRQPMLPMFDNIYKNRFYWDMYPSLSNFFLATNFHQDSSKNEIYKLTTDKEYVYLYSTPTFGAFSKEESLIGKIRKEWVPYISLAVKGIDSSYGTLPVYGYSVIQSAWGPNHFDPNRLIFNVEFGANGKPTPLSIHLIGYYWTDNPIDIYVNQHAYLKFTTMKVYEDFSIWLSKEKCNINGKEYEWIDDIFVEKTELKDLFISKDYDSFLGIFKSEDNSPFQWYPTGMEATISDLGSASGGGYLHRFSGYNVFLKGTDYQIEENTPVFEMSKNSQPQHFSFYTDNAYINNNSIKDSSQVKYTWQGCNVNILKWIFPLSGKCGTIGENLSILDNVGYPDLESGASPDLRGVNTVKFLGEYQEYNDNNYWVSGIYKNESNLIAKDKSFYSLGCAKIGFETPKNYGWTILGHSQDNADIDIPLVPPFAPTLVNRVNMGDNDLFIFEVSNRMGYKIKIYIKFDNLSFNVEVLPFGKERIDCVVPVGYDSYTSVAYSTIY